MGIFTLNFILVFVWIFISKALPISKARSNKFLLCLVYLQFVLIYVFRNLNVGQDTLGYSEYYDSIVKYDYNYWLALATGWEPGFVFVNYLCAKLGLTFYGFLLITALFCYYSIFRFFYRYSEDVGLSIVIFIAIGFFFGSLHILRQTWALAIILYSYDYIRERKAKKFFLIVFLAFLFHVSAILFSFAYFVYNVKFNIRNFTLYFIAFGVVVSLGGGLIVNYIMSLHSRYQSNYGDDLSQGKGYTMLFFLTMFAYLGLSILRRKVSSKQSLLYSLFLTGTLLQLLAPNFSMISRLIWYWNISITAYCPMLVSSIRNKESRTLTNILFYLVWIAFFIFTNRLEGIEEYATYTPAKLNEFKLFY